MRFPGWLKKHWAGIAGIITLLSLGAGSVLWIVGYSASEKEFESHKGGEYSHPALIRSQEDIRQRLVMHEKDQEQNKAKFLEIDKKLDGMQNHAQFQTQQLLRIAEKVGARKIEPPINLTTE